MRLRLVLVAALLALALTPGVSAQATGPDATVVLTPEDVGESDPQNVLSLASSSDARWQWNLTLTKPYTTIEFQASGLGLERVRQLVPFLVVPDDQYPLFHLYPNERVWEADTPSQVFHVTGDGDDLVLRIGVPGPGTRTLVLEIDTVPPAYELSAPENVTSIGFYLQTQTTELALGDLQVREAGATSWVENPTPAYHVLQRFPIQGLDADTEHEYRLVFTDWAGNEATSPTYRVRTAALPTVDPVFVRIVSPTPNATVPAEGAVIRATIDSVAEVPREGVRLFFDLQEVTSFDVEGENVSYAPRGRLADGMHRVSIEVTNAEGGQGVARWSFEVGNDDAPLSPAWLIVALLAAAGTMRASRRP